MSNNYNPQADDSYLAHLGGDLKSTPRWPELFTSQQFWRAKAIGHQIGQILSDIIPDSGIKNHNVQRLLVLFFQNQFKLRDVLIGARNILLEFST